MNGGPMVARLVPWALAAVTVTAVVQCRSEAPDGGFAARFEKPGAEARPMFRWWWPGGLVDPAEITREVDQIADADFGGVEIADVWDSVVTIDPVQYGFGTPAWNAGVEAALRAAKRRGLRVDLTIGPHWPSVVPSENPDDVIFAKELAHGQAVVKGGSTYEGPAPAPVVASKPWISAKTLVAVQALRCAASCTAEPPIGLREETLVDLTASVGEDGTLSWTAPAEGQWVLLSFWERGTGQRSAMYGPNPDNSPLTDPDAYVVDHYSRAGTEAVQAWWESSLLTPAIRSLLADVGGAFFEDSLELQTSGQWTPGFLDEFEKRRGYSFRPWLAVIPSVPQPGFPPRKTPAFAFAGDDAERAHHDYDQTVSDLWLENRIAPFVAWAHSLGMEYRNQGYGEPVDSILSAATTDIPEGESLGFGDNLDAFRALASGRDMGRKRILSDEVGAFFDGAYATTWRQMLETMNANYAAGVNRMVPHGFAYADAPNARWPGFQPFSPFRGRPGFAEGWGPRQPTWIHITDISSYLARTQLVLQSGRALVDVAIYRPSFNVGRGGPYFGDHALARAGYTYGFVSHGVLELPAATVDDGRLAPDGPAYGALVLDRQSTLSLDVAGRILGYARAGLPIVVVGPPPIRTPGARDAATRDADLQGVVAELLDLPSVRRVASEADVPEALLAAGVRPGAQFGEPSDLLSVRRREGDVDFFFLYNPGEGRADVTASLAAPGRAYRLDAWTGTIEPVEADPGEAGRVRVRVRLAPQQTTILGVTEGDRFGTGGTGTTGGASSAEAASNGRAPQTLSRWHLTVEDWQPGARATETKKVSHEVDLDALAPWTEIPGLEDVSGVGRYTTKVSLEAGWPGATLELGQVMDTCRVTINGQALPPVDPMSPVVPAGPYLKAGDNTLVIEVATPLGNRLRVTNPDVFGSRTRQAYGLMGPVRLVPGPGTDADAMREE